ncbi:hypothetical protein H7I53_06905 [Mycolicibacterium pulveris]|uniref:Uncharacterized protein n=1 Tax=Mycolicibacterium pulveris TaxID=36813 RepID=A0A7I7UL07_MYCPV|nr:hypothetical protein [Mycolicibacterium pulveris]MCV6979956.1 hypothetical protein [Mycolicibacterium pulveris]BBY81329.1 hypothetical protein MPUL_24870 [Mycolicibacterium pulveris]
MAEREVASFDAFDPSTWRFEPVPTPWYRGRQAMAALFAVAAAAVAIVVSGALLLFDGSDADVVVEQGPTATSAPRPAPSSAPVATSAGPSAPPPPVAPPPAPAEVTAQPVVPPPARTAEVASPTRVTKEPEFGVTRTKETRRPISVAPRRP